MAKEKQFECKIKRWLKERGVFCIKFFANSFTAAGIPDLICCVNGYSVWIEVKAQDGHPSELQLDKIKQIRKAGGFAYIVYPSGWERLKEIIIDLEHETFNRDSEVILK